jgi:hypothetical protein
MKNFIIIAALAFLASCAKQTITAYEYSATGRGYNLTVAVTKDSTTLTEYLGRNGAKVNTYVTEPALWKSLNENSKKIELKKISDLESPTNRRDTDAALYGKMTFKTADTVYVSSSFDAGQPHLIMKPVVDSLANLKKKN